MITLAVGLIRNALRVIAVLTALLVVGKVFGLIAWSWWWVLAPVWISLAGWMALIVGLACYAIWVDYGDDD